MPRYEDLGYGITCIDNEPTPRQMVANYLIQQGDKVAFIDVGTSFSVPFLLELLKQKNIPLTNVQYLLITHIHLDHAGGTGMLLPYLPNAKVVLHPQAIRHMIQPEKLVASAKAVYGDQVFEEQYGEVKPVPQDRILEARDGLILHLGRRPLLFLDTPGHARHHYSVVDVQGKGVFAGDTFGVSYRFWDQNDLAFIYPATTPTQFDPEAYHKSINRLVSYELPYMYITHFSRVKNVKEIAKVLHRRIDEFAQAALSVVQESNRFQALGTKIRHLMEHWLQEQQSPISTNAFWQVVGPEIDLDVMGLLCWLSKANGG